MSGIFTAISRKTKQKLVQTWNKIKAIRQKNAIFPVTWAKLPMTQYFWNVIFTPRNTVTSQQR
jgi:hypothetical protein